MADSDLHLWAAAIAAERGLNVTVSEPDVSPLAIQGPKATDVAVTLFGNRVKELRPFAFFETLLDDIPMVLARSGWSKQGGFALYLTDGRKGTALWQRVKEAGSPFGIGPGAPSDIERIESGLISYGADMRRQALPADPFEMGFGKMVSLDTHDFIGRAALRRRFDAGVTRQRVGFVVEGACVSSLQRPVVLEQGERVMGMATDLVYSNRVGASIGVGIAETDVTEQSEGLTIALPEGHFPVRLANLPFI